LLYGLQLLETRRQGERREGSIAATAARGPSIRPQVAERVQNLFSALPAHAQTRASSLDGSLNPTSFHTPDALAAELTHLSRLDKRLSAVLERGAIKLLRADWLRRPGAQEEDPRILRRQDLELREARTGERIFLSPEEAASVLRAGRREIAALAYGWCAMDDPDPTGEYLAG